ncbi:excisionase family DNA-binding protein [Nocardioides sp. NPDC051685]|jgi:excisionase family DNA binding protein|uniref:excisionase family DNA-binding protein n=1 Tax=Nocardioides sp. NPDC051685 TaxID=3364334 RepID=UPI0037A10E45
MKDDQTETRVVFTRKWFTVREVAEQLGYGETKVRMLIAQGRIRSLKDGRSRRVLPQWVDEYVELCAEQSEMGVA